MIAGCHSEERNDDESCASLTERSFNEFRMTAGCHSEERSDEESWLLLSSKILHFVQDDMNLLRMTLEKILRFAQDDNAAFRMT